MQNLFRLQTLSVRFKTPTLSYFFAAFALLVSSLPAMAQYVTVPNMTAPVIDEAHMFTSQEENELNQRLKNLYSSGGPQMVVWTLASLNGEDIEGVSIRAVDKWKLGQEKKDDGLLLTIALAERRTRLEVGRGLEGDIPDIIANRLLQGVLRPALRQNEPAAGVHAVISSIEERLGREPTTSAQEQRISGHSLPSGLIVLMFTFLFVVLSIVSRFRRFGLGSNRRRGWYGGWGGGGGGWGSGGGGGWSGGGGGFSGGGSSGNW